MVRDSDFDRRPLLIMCPICHSIKQSDGSWMDITLSEYVSQNQKSVTEICQACSDAGKQYLTLCVRCKKILDGKTWRYRTEAERQIKNLHYLYCPACKAANFL